MPTTVAGTFTAKGVSASIAADNLPVEITFSITGTFSATWQIERSKTPDGSAWEVVYGPSRLTDSAVVQAQPNERFRARCSAFTSGTITYTMSDRAMSPGPQRILGGFRNDGPAWMVPAGVTAPTFGGNTPNLNVAGASFAQGTVGIARWSANATGGQLAIGHSRATVVGDQTALVDADALGQVGFYGSDGVDLILGAWIKPLVTGSPSAGVMPTSITFGTAVSNNVPVERMRIDPNGNVGIGFSSSLTKLSVNGPISRGVPIGKTLSFTLAASEGTIICNGAGTITVTLPAGSATPGRELWIKTVAAQLVVSASSNVVPQAGGAAGTAILAATAGKWALLIADGTNWTIMASN